MDEKIITENNFQNQNLKAKNESEANDTKTALQENEANSEKLGQSEILGQKTLAEDFDLNGNFYGESSQSSSGEFVQSNSKKLGQSSSGEPGQTNSGNSEQINSGKAGQSKFSAFMKNFKDFVIRKKEYFITLGIFTGMFLIFLLIAGLFSGKNTILYGDAYEQIGVFFDHIFNVLEGKSSLFYSNYFGRGIEIFSTIQYMYTNPFYIVVLLGGRQNVFSMFTLAFYLMLAFNGIIFLWFSNRHFKNLNLWTRVLFALLYIFSGYANFCYAFITWMIYPALILILADRFLNFMKTGKITSFIIVFVWYVISCYSVGISTAIVLFVIFTLYILVTEEKDKRFEKLSSLFVVFVVTALSSIVLIFPSFMAVTSTGRSGSLLYNLLAGKNNSISKKIAVLFSDLSVLTLCLIYLVKSDKKEKINKFFILAFLVLLAPMVFDSIMNLLCLSKYMGFTARFYFVNEALIFVLALLAIDKNILNLKSCESDKTFKLLFYLISFVVAIVTIILEVCSFSTVGSHIKNPISTGSALSLFLIIFCMISFLIVLAILLNKFKKFSEKMAKGAICFTLVLMLVSNFLIFSCKAGSSTKDRTEIDNLISNCGVSGGNFKTFGREIDESLYNFASENIRKSSAFSSLLPSSILDSYEYLSYYSGSTVYLDTCGSLISDAMLGINYYVSKVEQNRPYLELVSKTENYYLYRNTLAGTGAFYLGNDFLFDDELSFNENLEKLKEYFGIAGTIFEDVEPKNIQITGDEVQTDDVSPLRKFKFTAPYTGILYLKGLYNNVLSSKEKLKGVEGFNFLYAGENLVEDLAYLEAGTEYEFYIDLTDKLYATEPEFTFLNFETALKICEKIKDNSLEYTYEKNGYKVQGEIPSNANVYVLTPDLNGYEYNLNGETISSKIIFKGMVYFSNVSGEFNLSVNYKYPYLKLWIVAFVAIALVVALFLVAYHYTKFKHIQRIIGYAMIGVFGIIIIVFYIFGFLISIVNMFL